MKPVEILDDLFFIERGFLNGNHFVYRGDEPVLIDTAYSRGFGETEAAVKYLGVALEDIRLIISTHCHSDHIGGNRRIQDLSGCDVALHRIGKHFIDTRDDWATWWRYYGQEADFFSATNALEDGDTLTIGPHVFQVLHTPGHASDGIVLYHAEARLLISSDTLWEQDVPVITVRVEGSTAAMNQLASLERLESLEVDVVYPGHGPAFADFENALAQSKQKMSDCLIDRQKLGDNMLKRIIVFTVLLRGKVEAATFFQDIMNTPWFPETVDFYFDGNYQVEYQRIVDGLTSRGILQQNNGWITTTVKP